jgi:hypothetical protein
MANEVRITVGADTKDADRNLKTFREKLDKLSANARKVGIGLSAMGAAGVLAIKGFTSAALEQERAVKTLASVVGSAGESFADVEAKIMATTAALQKKTNFGDEEQIRVLAKLVPMLGSTDAALAALPAVMEVATVTGKDFNSVVDTMGPVLAGMTNRIRGTSLEFDAAQGPMERVAHIMATLGGAAEADVDPFIQMGNAIGDVKESIGSALLPIITPLIAKITRLAEWLQTINPSILKWGAGILAAATALGLIGGPLLIFLSFMPKIIMGLKGMAMATLSFNKAILANPVVLVFAAVAGALAIFVTMWSQNMFGIRDKARVAFVAVGDFLVSAINKMISGLQMAAEKLSFLLPKGVEEAIAGIKPLEIETGKVFDNVVNKADDFAGDLKDKFKGFMFPAGEESGEGLGSGIHQGLMPKIDETVEQANEKLGEIGKKVPSLTDNLNTLGLTFDDARDRVFALTSEGMSSFDAWEKVTEHFASKVDQKFQDIVNNYGKVGDASLAAAETAEEAADRMAAAAEAAAARISAAFGSKAGALGFESNLVGIGAMESFAGLTGKALIDKVAEVNAEIAGIAGMAHGGFVGGAEGAPSLAMVHGGELVLNRSQQAEMGSTFNITVNGSVDDPQQMARLIAQEVDAVIGRNAVRNEQLRSR